MRRTPLRLAAALAGLALLGTACSGSDATVGAAGTPAPTSASASASATTASPSASPSPSPSPSPSLVGSAGPGTVVTPQLFGMHAKCFGNTRTICRKRGGAYPSVPFGSFRIWDSKETWAQVQPSRGTFAFRDLDATVERIRANGQQVVYVLAMTPEWASARPADSNYAGRGALAEPKDLADWTRFVSTVAKRYKGRIGAYEIWNEPNIRSYWTGTPEKLAEMTVLARDAIKAADPAAQVVGPSLSARDKGSMPWFAAYLGAGAAKALDVVSMHAYPPAGVSSEDMYALVGTVRAQAVSAGMSQATPIWVTEAGAGRTQKPPAKSRLYSGEAADGLVARAYLNALYQKAARAYWYAWDDREYSGTYLVEADRKTRTRAADAYAQTYSWLVGSVFHGCTVTGALYRCRISWPTSSAEIVWSSKGTETYQVPADATCVMRLNQPVLRPAPATLQAGQVPVAVVRPGGDPTAEALADTVAKNGAC